MTNSITPLLKVGSFGTHVIKGDNGYFFVGTIPTNMAKGVYSTETDAIAVFVNWFKSQDADFQRSHVGNLRNDVFAMLFN